MSRCKRVTLGAATGIVCPTASTTPNPRRLMTHGAISGPLAFIGLLGLACLPVSASSQSVSDATRLSGLMQVQTRAEAEWDEHITVEAGGATPDQFLQALGGSFRDAISEADAAPSVVDGAPVTVTCHVDTFYDTGLIVYSLRVQTEEPGADGSPVITWIKSGVGSYTVQQLHLMFRLGEQCAESFLEDWRGVN